MLPKFLSGTEDKGPVGKYECRMNDTIKMYLQDIQFEGVK
jgi:hypothetical protein